MVLTESYADFMLKEVTRNSLNTTYIFSNQYAHIDLSRYIKTGNPYNLKATTIPISNDQS